MGLRTLHLLSWGFLFCFLTGTANAAPQLRLETAAVGPISIAVGQNGGTPTVNAYNAGDGALNLTVASSAAWLVPSVGAAGPCDQPGGSCIPILLDLQTATLEKDSFTAIVSVTDPNAVDAPQSISVTVQMGGGVPDQASFFVAPNGSSDVLGFQTNSALSFNTATASGGNWLSMAALPAGSFDFVRSFEITAQHIQGLPEGSYNGTVNVTNSAFQPDIKAVPVTLQVTSQPIAVLNAAALAYRVAEGSLPFDKYLTFNNRGLGVLEISAINVTTADAGTWLTAENTAGSNLIKVTANPEGLAAGEFTGSIEIQSNAVNGPHAVEVALVVSAQAGPTISFGGVVNNATFARGEELPQGGIIALFGQELTLRASQWAAQVPLERELDGVKVFVNGQDTPLYFTSYGQINFQLPYETPVGEAIVQVTRDGQSGNRTSIQVVPAAPRMLTFLGNYAISQNPDGSYSVPAGLGVNGRPARTDEVVVIYAIGFGPTTPAAATGAGAPTDPLARILPSPTAFFGSGLASVPQVTDFVGLSPGFVGLYQINVRIPGNAPRGDSVPLIVQMGAVISNSVVIAIE